jgi:stage V sporulation protein G
MKLHADIAHPINAECRRKIQEKVTAAFTEEMEKSKQPGYKPTEMDEPDDEVPEVIS